MMKNIAFYLLGKCDDSNPSSIPIHQIREWENEKLIYYLGESNDVKSIITQHSCIILPSYKEGIPRALLEAMSMEKPIITTNVSGCKECIQPPLKPYKSFLIGQNGILIPPKSSDALLDAITYLLNLPQDTLNMMGKNGRNYAKSRFEISLTLATYRRQIASYGTHNKKLLFISNTSFGMFNFRLPILQALKNDGYEIHIIAPQDQTSVLLQQEGFILYPINLNSKGLNPFQDFLLFLILRRLIRSINPTLVLNYTIKPAIYASLACQTLKIPHIAIITGLGYVFIKGGIKKKMLKLFVSFLYKISLKKASVWFLNHDDQDTFLSHRLIKPHQAMILDSEGVDTEFFKPTSSNPKQFSFLLIARMLWDKGIKELIEAIRKGHQK